MHPAKKTCKAIAIAICLLVSVCSYSQSASVEYFEAGSSPTTDSSETSVTLVLAIANSENADSLYLTVVDGEGASLYAGANTLAGWKSGSPNRTEGATLYLTIEGGSYANLDRYVATALLKNSNGDLLSYTRP